MQRDEVTSEFKALLTLAIPLALAQAGQALMGVVDTAVVGRLSEGAQAAVGLGNGLFFACGVPGIGVMLSFDPLISQAIGAKDFVRARSLYWQSVWVACGVAAVLVLPCMASPLALAPAGVAPELAGEAQAYVWWRLGQLPPMFLFFGARSYLQAVGRTRPIFVAMVLANVVNLGLDVWFVYGWGPVPPLGVRGAALATTLCAWAQWAAVLWAVRGDSTGASRRWVKSDVLMALKVGIPIGLQMLAEVGIFVLAGILSGAIDETSAAAHQIAINWSSMSFCLSVGIGSAAATRVGWAVGAGNPRAMRRAGVVAFAAGMAVMSVSALVLVLAPSPLIAVMTDKPRVFALALALFKVAAVFQLSDGLQAVGSGVLRGAGDTRFPFIANVVGYWVIAAPLVFFLGFTLKLGVVGLWWGLVVGLTVVAASLVARFIWLSRRGVDALN